VKAVCLTIIVYLVLSSTQFCQDTMTACENAAESTTETTVLQTDPDPGTCPDECPQSCACTCCAHPVASRSFSVASPLNVAETAHAEAVAFYAEPFTDTFSHSIWQPPKV